MISTGSSPAFPSSTGPACCTPAPAPASRPWATAGSARPRSSWCMTPCLRPAIAQTASPTRWWKTQSAARRASIPRNCSAPAAPAATSASAEAQVAAIDTQQSHLSILLRARQRPRRLSGLGPVRRGYAVLWPDRRLDRMVARHRAARAAAFARQRHLLGLRRRRLQYFFARDPNFDVTQISSRRISLIGCARSRR